MCGRGASAASGAAIFFAGCLYSSCRDKSELDSPASSSNASSSPSKYAKSSPSSMANWSSMAVQTIAARWLPWAPRVLWRSKRVARQSQESQGRARRHELNLSLSWPVTGERGWHRNSTHKHPKPRPLFASRGCHQPRAVRGERTAAHAGTHACARRRASGPIHARTAPGRACGGRACAACICSCGGPPARRRTPRAVASPPSRPRALRGSRT